jgi:hypothetical protein
MYASKLLNLVENNYTTIEGKVVVMVYALQKFKHYLLGNQLYFMLTTWPLCT